MQAFITALLDNISDFFPFFFLHFEVMRTILLLLQRKQRLSQQLGLTDDNEIIFP